MTFRGAEIHEHIPMRVLPYRHVIQTSIEVDFFLKDYFRQNKQEIKW